MKKISNILVATLIVLLLFGCGMTTKEKDWTYGKLEENFGGIVDIDCASVRNCINQLHWKDFYVCGYVVDISYNGNRPIVFIADKEISDEYILVIQDEKRAIEPQVGELIYVEGVYENVDYDYAAGILNCMVTNKEYSASTEKVADAEYMTVHEYLQLNEKVYQDTWIRTEGVLFQDGAKYKLYSSESSYKDEPMKYVEIEFADNMTNLNGKTVKIIGNADDRGTSNNGLVNCNLLDE